MSKNIDRNLEIISNIDEDIIDRNTEKRIRYINCPKKPKRKKFIPIIAIAAAVAILLSVAAIIIVPMMTPKNVPVYTGMTVSSTDGSQAVRKNGVVSLSSIIMLDNTNSDGNNGNHGANNKNKKPIEDILGDSVDIESGEELYYARPGETIKITIHFDNPDQYEILSFTLNGAKYGAHMFLEGSDMEELTVNYTIDENAEGVTECTIDAIKYVDGTTIKDVKIGGDRTVNIGIYSENQPTAKIENEVLGATDVSFNVTVDDPLGFIAITGGKIQAVLADSENIIKTYDLSVGENKAVKFEGLDPDKYYRYAVVAIYDAFDGKGISTHILFESSINEYNIKYILDGGVLPEVNVLTLYTSEEGASFTILPTKEGYVFSGWTYGTQTKPQSTITIVPGTHGDVEVTANWKKFELDLMAVVENGTGIGFDYSGYLQVYHPNTGDYRSHWGVDIRAYKDALVYALIDGTVSKIINDAGWGTCIEIDHGSGYVTVYKCLDAKLPENIAEGEYVAAGECIGYVGEPAYSESHTSYHLHFEVLINNEYVDPKDYAK